MSQANDNILYIPIQINGGTTLPNDLLERELFIKNGELYVGTGSGNKEMIIGRVVPGATINAPTLVNSTLKGSLILDTTTSGIVMDKETFNSNKDIIKTTGRLVFVDEGEYV